MVYYTHSTKLETGLRTNSAGIPYAILLRIQAVGFPTSGPLTMLIGSIVVPVGGSYVGSYKVKLKKGTTMEPMGT